MVLLPRSTEIQPLVASIRSFALVTLLKIRTTIPISPSVLFIQTLFLLFASSKMHFLLWGREIWGFHAAAARGVASLRNLWSVAWKPQISMSRHGVKPAQACGTWGFRVLPRPRGKHARETGVSISRHTAEGRARARETWGFHVPPPDENRGFPCFLRHTGNLGFP